MFFSFNITLCKKVGSMALYKWYLAAEPDSNGQEME